MWAELLEASGAKPAGDVDQARGDGIDASHTLGVDMRLATSSFLGSQNLAATVAAASEDRFTRKKGDADFPARAVAYCLKTAGVKTEGLGLYADQLTSADSLAWSYAARKEARAGVRRNCAKKACNNCKHYALAWRDRVLRRLETRQLTFTYAGGV